MDFEATNELSSVMEGGARLKDTASRSAGWRAQPAHGDRLGPGGIGIFENARDRLVLRAMGHLSGDAEQSGISKALPRRVFRWPMIRV